jgi:hypothetical protein
MRPNKKNTTRVQIQKKEIEEIIDSYYKSRGLIKKTFLKEPNFISDLKKFISLLNRKAPDASISDTEIFELVRILLNREESTNSDEKKVASELESKIGYTVYQCFKRLHMEKRYNEFYFRMVINWPASDFDKLEKCVLNSSELKLG